MSKIYFSLDVNTAKKLSQLFKKNELCRIYRGIYTDNLKDSPDSIVKSHWMQIVSYVVPKGILSFRTAFDLKPASFEKGQGIVFITSTYNKTITLPGLIIKVYKGDPKVYHEQVLPTLAKSNTARMLLENLTVVKSPKLQGVKTIGQIGVEKYLSKELQLRGESSVNQLKDQAKIIGRQLHYESEYQHLSKIISALLSTNEISILQSSYAKAVANKEPFDENRLHSFEALAIYLQKCVFNIRKFDFSVISFKNLTFFESYFSNFIEGTEFDINEAEKIVFEGEEIYHRHADSHDILANFYLSCDYSEMNVTPVNADEFLKILKARHAYLMKERPEKDPGNFKNKVNRAGSTTFVDPQSVIGTLTRGFEFYQILPKGLPKALFMHFLIAEVHPFNDGNGRIARIMMNAELVNAGLYKIIVPTVCRDNYLGGLRRATRDNFFHTYCKVLDQLQAYTATVPWFDYLESREKIEHDKANLLTDEGLPMFNRALRALKLSDLPP